MTFRQFLSLIPWPLHAGMVMYAMLAIMAAFLGQYSAAIFAMMCPVLFYLGLCVGLETGHRIATEKKPRPPVKITDRIWFSGDDAC